MKKILSFTLLLLYFCIFPQEIIIPNTIPFSKKLNKNTFAEVLIQTPEKSNYKIKIGNYSIENDIGIFYFFGLNSGQQKLSIYKNNELIHNSLINIENNHRLIFNFCHNKGLLLLEESPIQSNIIHELPLNEKYFHKKKVMNNYEFNQFLSYFKRQEFGKEKLQAFKNQSISTAFTTHQIIQLMKLITFDNDKLPLAKLAFKDCIDPENYYLVIETLDFASSKKELNNFINKHYK